MPLDFADDGKLTKPVQALFDFAAGKVSDYEFPSHKNSRQGRGQGILTGGNLSLLAGLVGSRSALETQDKVLFIEEVGEKWYRFDRMMLTLKRAGMFDGLAGLIVGGLTGMEAGAPEFDFPIREIVLQHVGDVDCPVAFGFPAGHFPENYPLIMGRNVEFSVGSFTKLEFEK
jgi:muramoyltetrapeptide carboxypeptidase